MKRFTTFTLLILSFSTLASFGAFAQGTRGLTRVPFPSASLPPKPTESNPDGKGTIGMVCTDFEGNQITWKEDGFQSCVQRVMSRATDQISHDQSIAPGANSVSVRLDTFVYGFNEFMQTSDQVCTDKRFHLEFFY